MSIRHLKAKFDLLLDSKNPTHSYESHQGKLQRPLQVLYWAVRLRRTSKAWGFVQAQIPFSTPFFVESKGGGFSAAKKAQEQNKPTIYASIRRHGND